MSVNIMNGRFYQQRLYIINRAGSGDAHYVQLSYDHTEIISFSVKTDHWRAIKNLCNFGVAVVDNLLYIIGGFDKIHARPVDQVLRYNPDDGEWKERAPLFRARAKFGTCVSDGKIYVTGGELNDGKLTSTCEIYDPGTNKWEQGSSLKSPRANHACGVYQDDIYVAGGCFGNQSHDNIWVYEGDKWNELDKDYPHRLPVNIDRCAMVSVGRHFYFIGGVCCKVGAKPKDTSFFTEHNIFSYCTNVSALSSPDSVNDHIKGSSLAQEFISPWNKDFPNMTYARHSAAATLIGHRIYVFGGSVLETGVQVRPVEYFDLYTGKWEEDFRFRKGDVSNVTCAILEVPNKHDEVVTKNRLKWILW